VFTILKNCSIIIISILKGDYKMIIKGARLLTEEEFIKYQDKITPISNSWWLSTGKDGFVQYVDFGNTINHTPLRPQNANLEIRPVLDIDAEGYVGPKFKFASKNCMILDEHLAIVNGSIGCQSFGNTDNYDESPAKETTEEWFEEHKDEKIYDKYGVLN
jgi:hypothetical protein